MPKKKKTDEVVEEVKVADEVIEETAEAIEEAPAVEEKPKKTTSKKTKAKAKVEEKPVEEPVVEEPVVEEPAEKPVEEPIVLTDVQVIKVTESVGLSAGDKAIVIAKSGIAVLKGPGLNFTKVSMLNTGAKVIISDISGNFARIGANKWININYISKI